MRSAFLLTAAIAFTGGASIAAGPDAEPTGPGRASDQQPVQTVEADQAEHYALLRRPRAPEDRLRDQAVDFVNAMMTKSEGAAPGLARRSQVTARNVAVYVIPARGFVCMYITSLGTDEGSGTCNHTGEALKGYVTSIEWPAPGIHRISGLVTDEITEVRLRDAKGNVERVTPVNNTYVFETTMWPKQIEVGDEVMPVPEHLGD